MPISGKNNTALTITNPAIIRIFSEQFHFFPIASMSYSRLNTIIPEKI